MKYKNGLAKDVVRQYRCAVREQRLRSLIATRRELAKRTGIGYASLTEIETGRRFPSIFAALVIADDLGCRLDDLFERRGQGSALNN